MKLIRFLVFFFFTYFSYSQDNSNLGLIVKNSISGNILGTGSYVGISYERLFFDRIYTEVGI